VNVYPANEFTFQEVIKNHPKGILTYHIRIELHTQSTVSGIQIITTQIDTKYKRWNLSNSSFDLIEFLRDVLFKSLFSVSSVSRINFFSKYVGNVIKKQIINKIHIKRRDRRTEHVRLA